MVLYISRELLPRRHPPHRTARASRAARVRLRTATYLIDTIEVSTPLLPLDLAYPRPQGKYEIFTEQTVLIACCVNLIVCWFVEVVYSTAMR